MVWIILLLAGILEIAWAVGLKYSNNFTRPLPSALTIIAMIISIWLLSYSMKTLPIGTAYAIWTGIGIVGTFLLGIVLFNEPMDIGRIICAGLIVLGIVGLKVLST